MKYRDYDPILALHKVTHRDLFGGVNPPLIDSITFDQDPALLEQCFAGITGASEDHYVYARLDHPNCVYLANQISAIENADWTTTFASGQGAMAAAMNALTKSGDAIVASTRLYGGTLKLLRSLEAFRGVEVVFVDIANHEQVRQVLEQHKPKILLMEAISNPSLVASDIGFCSKLAHLHGSLVVVDNTFSPFIVLPLRLGADFVVHSLTKYMGRQSDGIGGSISLRKKLPAEVKASVASYLALHGAVLNHKFAHAITLRLPSLWHSYKVASLAAFYIASKLQQMGLQVYYPGLSSYPYRSVIKKIMRTTELGHGGMVAVDFGSRDEAIRFIRNVRKEHVGYSAVSLGSNHFYVCAPVSSVSSGIEEEVPAELTPSLVRISVGDNLPAELLWRNLSKAL